MDLAIVILAGGKSVRYNATSPKRSKFLIGFDDGSTLLSQLLDKFSSIEEVQKYICVSEENHDEVRVYLESSSLDIDDIHLIESNKTDQGPIIALGNCIESIEAEYIILLLADIYYSNFPIDKLKIKLGDKSKAMIFCGSPEFSKNNEYGGVVFHENEILQNIYYRLDENELGKSAKSFWTGAILLEKKYFDLINEDPFSFENQALETWVRAINQNLDIEIFDCGKFINVNYREELEYINRQMNE